MITIRSQNDDILVTVMIKADWL